MTKESGCEMNWNIKRVCLHQISEVEAETIPEVKRSHEICLFGDLLLLTAYALHSRYCYLSTKFSLYRDSFLSQSKSKSCFLNNQAGKV
ncbi:CLUMA_CG016872, isoform A [Clunio marinus]|uniref:CLUMA_CG016872, isoform A n=1 Tax=Clunio marinus TaxID=568069 RepID=A0A1J1IU82_9DIPT|nr:CLUMA_CG016872, isoform A [Clunio marinus]